MISPHDSSATLPSSSPSPDQGNDTTAAARSTIDQTLIQRFNAGDSSAFVALMARHRSRIFNVSLGLLRNRADAEEITQDTFIRIHRGLAKFRGSSSFATWAYRIAVNLSRNRYWYYFRRRRQDSFSMDQAFTPDNPATFSDLVADDSPDPVRTAITTEFAALIARCMGQLEAPHREVLTLRNTLNHSYGEIAASLKINTGTVKSRIARARGNLRALLVAACPEFSHHSELGDWLQPVRAAHSHPTAVAA